MAEQISMIGTVILMMVVDFKQMAIEFRKFFELDSTQNFPALNIAEKNFVRLMHSLSSILLPMRTGITKTVFRHITNIVQTVMKLASRNLFTKKPVMETAVRFIQLRMKSLTGD